MSDMNNNLQLLKLAVAFNKLKKAKKKNIIAKAERKWIEANPNLNILNYHYHRYLTNEFETYLLTQRHKSDEKEV